MKTADVVGPFGILTILITSLALSACAPASDSRPKADPVLLENTEVFIGDQQYYLEPVAATATSRESSETDLGANARILQELGTSARVTEPTQLPSEPASPNVTAPAEKTEPGAKKPSASKPKKPAPKEKPIDVEFILTKSQTISVGVASLSPQARIQNGDRAFIPASITKVMTTAAALEELGEGFKFQTRIGFDLASSGQATNLVIVADGDPTAGIMTYQAGAPNRMQDIAAALKARGVRAVSGEIKLVSTDPRMDTTTYAAGIPNIDMRECYGSLATSFNYRSNCANTRLSSKTGFQWESSSIADLVDTQVETVSGEKNSLTLEPLLSPERMFLGFRVAGTYSAKSPRVLQLRLPIGNAAQWYGQSLVAALKAAQVQTSKTAVKFARTSEERSLALREIDRLRDQAIVVESAPLANIVEATNKPSDNFLADSLFKAIGSRRGSRNATLVDASRSVLKSNLEKWLRADGHGSWSNELHLIEGAGLSTENRATPRAFLSVMRQLTKQSYFSTLWESLPVAGAEGTLSDRMKQTVAEGKVRAKTGTLTGSYQLVGYIPKARGSSVEYVPFVILTSTVARERATVRKFQDALVVEMMTAVLKEP